MTWLARWAHVIGAAVWVGGYAVLALVVVPVLAREPHDSTRRLALAAVRVLSFSGTLTILAGLFLITRSRGFGSLGGEWGSIVIGSAVVAVLMMAIGDAALRPAIRRIGPDAPVVATVARRWALIGLALGIIALGLMTRVIYARS